MVRTRLESNVGSRAFGFTFSHSQGMDFGMWFSGSEMITFSDYLSITNDDATNIWIRSRGIDAALSEPDGARHH